MDQSLDVRGIPCPQPVIRAKAAMKAMTKGTLTILADDEIAVQNLMKLGNFSNAAPTSEKTADGEYRVIFHIEDGDSPGEAKTVCAPDSRKKGLVVALSSDRMGEGDEELGRILMKGYIYALTQLEELPETILLYNGGARLSTDNSDSVEDLESLQAQGVEILTCGTCLNYYQLSESLRVGGVTNMYEIAERMARANSVVKP